MVFACIWLSIHVNIPAPDDNWGRVAIRRVWTTVLAFFVPELVAGWAVQQLRIASEIAKENKGGCYSSFQME